MQTGLILAFLGLAGLRFLLERRLAGLNLRSAREQVLQPSSDSTATAVERLRRNYAYLAADTRFDFIRSSFELLLILAVIFSGILAAVYHWFEQLPLHPNMAAILFLWAGILAHFVILLPFRWYGIFRIEARFGFNRTTPRLFWSDQFRIFLLLALIGVPLTTGLYLIIVQLTFWWLWAALFLVAVQFILLYLYPAVIAPMFNRFTPLANPDLERQLTQLAADCGFPVAGIQVMDSSRRTAHANAYFTGFGRHRRIVLYDTLLNRLTLPEIRAVTAHELGHYHHRHLWKLLGMNALLVLAGCRLLELFLNSGLPVESFHLPAGAPAPALALAVLLSGTFLFWLGPFLHGVQRRFEYAADAFSARIIASPAPLIAGLAKLAESNLDLLEPHPAYTWYYHSHPTFRERTARLSRIPVTVSAANQTLPTATEERGVALIIVLGTLAVLGVMVTHLSVISEVVASEAKVASTRIRLAYVAESAADRAYWLLLSDRRRFVNRSLGVPAGDAATAATAAADRWMMDGIQHQSETTEGKVQVQVYDADSGLDFSGPNPAPALRTVLQTDVQQQNEVLDRFLDVLSDYIDADDSQRLHGQERNDYEANECPDLPRNGILQLREEVLWLPGLQELLALDFDRAVTTAPTIINIDSLRIIPPPGLLFPRTQRPAFFSASPAVLQRLLNLAPADLNLVLEARQRWQLENTPLTDTLPPEMLQQVSSRFSLMESGVGLFQVTATSPNGEIRREISAIRDCRNLRGSGNLGTPVLVYWEKFSP